MAYDIALEDRVREFLVEIPKIRIEEKRMFRGLAFLINGKMCINISQDRLMCRFDPELVEDVSEKKGYEVTKMGGRVLAGYCYVNPEGFKMKKDFEYWLKLCLDFNPKAKASKKKKSSRVAKVKKRN
jgi:hypothetical protein